VARQRRGRPVNGILVVDKPQLLTSNAVLQQVKRLYYAAKAGHTGSLDPLATGVLPLCFGEATKFSQYLLDADKAYRTTIVLGVSTASGDADGEVIARQDASHVTQDAVERALQAFRGEITQVPSMYSALKHQGQPLYKLARQGIEVERASRSVTVHENVLEAFRPGPQPEVDLFVRCSKGTYIRSIAEDLGQALGCGGHVARLRRTQAGPYSERDAVTMSRLEELRDREAFDELDALLLPVTSALSHLPQVTVSGDAAYYFRQGQAVRTPRLPLDGLVCLSGDDGMFIGVGEILDDGRVAPRRLIASAA
jgi:tRNA pseudouridine55 synthase